MQEKLRFGMGRKLPPTQCPDCNLKLGPVEYGRKFDAKYKIISPPNIDGFSHWRICICGCYIQWSYPNVWKRRHLLPIFDDRQIIQEAP